MKPIFLPASDGQLARVNGLYAEQKIAFLRHYLPAALIATTRKPSRHYIDVFGGPGRNITANGKHEFEGSPIVAAQAQAGPKGSPFETVDVFNIEPWSHDALVARFAAQSVRPQLTAHLGDGLTGTLARLGELPRRSYVMLGIDIEKGSDLPWTALQAIRAATPASTDAYLLFPVGMGLIRQISYRPDLWEQQARTMNEFFGDESWRAALDFRQSDSARNKRAAMQALTTAYLRRLKTLWDYPLMVRRVTLHTRQMLYYMILATSNPTAEKIATWEAGRSAQRDMFRG
jgi:three-Cys-motif partner protein